MVVLWDECSIRQGDYSAVEHLPNISECQFMDEAPPGWHDMDE